MATCEVPCNAGISTADSGNTRRDCCDYDSDLAPFGAVAQPGMEINDWAIMSNPYSWDSKEETVGNQPLFYEIPNGSMFNDSQARMGQGYTEGTINSRLFGQYYGRWRFTPNTTGELMQVTGHYTKHPSFSSHTTGGAGTAVFNAAFNPAPVQVNSLVKLTFNTRANSSHLPLISIRVAWGDGSVTSISGMEMRDRSEPENPHVMYHIYSTPGPKTATITVRDNWGAPGGGSATVTVQSNY
jgi:hypothetical protein